MEKKFFVGGMYKTYEKSGELSENELVVIGFNQDRTCIRVALGTKLAWCNLLKKDDGTEFIEVSLAFGNYKNVFPEDKIEDSELDELY